MLIREFRKKNLEKLIEIERESFLGEEKILSFGPERLRRMICRISGFPGRGVLKILKLLGIEPFKIFVAEIGEKIIGVAIISLNGKTCYISRVMVHPEFRRRGIGTLLTKTALDYARGKSLTAILHVNAANTAAKNMYKKLGFEHFESLVFLSAKVDSLRKQDVTHGISVRNFRNTDADIVQKLIEASSENSSSANPLSKDKKNLKTSFFERFFRSLFLMPLNQKIVLVKDRKIVGYAQTRYTVPKVVRVENIHTSLHVVSGIERTLIQAIADKMKDAGKETIIAVISSKRRNLLKNIKKMGFKKCLTMEGMMLTLKSVY